MLKAQATTYRINSQYPTDGFDDIVAMTAYGAPYFVAAEANSYTLGLMYTIPVDWYPLRSFNFYNDFGYVDKSNDSFKNTYMNVAGVSVSAGQMFVYLDFAFGKHMPWLNSDYSHSLAEGSSTHDSWEMRFNVNIGYYF